MKHVIILWCCLYLFACASSSKFGVDNPEFWKLVNNAEDAIDNAAEVGGEWRDSRTILQEAITQAKQGDMKQAFQLAEQAKEQGDMGYQQAIKQREVAGPWLF